MLYTVIILITLLSVFYAIPKQNNGEGPDYVDIHAPVAWETDIMFSDVGIQDLIEISELLNKSYLSVTHEAPKFPITGIIYGVSTLRPFVNLIVSRGKKSVNVPFLIDSGCPDIFLSAEAMSALMDDALPLSTYVNLHGFKQVNVFMSPLTAILAMFQYSDNNSLKPID